MFKHLTSRLLSSSSSRFLSSSLRLSLRTSSSSPLLSSSSSSSSLFYRSFSNNNNNNNTPDTTPTTPFHPSASDLADNHNKWSEDKWEQEEKKAAHYLAEPDPHENNNLLLLGAFSAILLACFYQMGENINKYKREAKADDGEEDDDEEGGSKKNSILKKWNQWNKPDQSILLPPEQPDIFGKRSRTVVLGLHDFLIHADWTRMDGWRIQKRPYYDDFIDRCIKSGWEIVLFSEKSSQEIDLLLQELDPHHKLKYRLASESLTHTGLLKLEKDISRLNRDPKRVIVLDYDDKYYSNSSLNLLKSIRFEGDIHDNTLLSLSELLEKINKYNIYDIREKITEYNKGTKLSDLFKKEEEQERFLLNNNNNNQNNYNNNNNNNQSPSTPSWLGGVISNAKKTGLRPGAKKVAENNE